MDNWKSDKARVTIRKERLRCQKHPPIQKMVSVVAIGMDVVALYPSIKRDMASKAVFRAIERADNE